MRIIKALLIFLLQVFICHAQPLSNDYELYTKKDGLPHDNISCLLQDSYGLIWIGTYDGLCVYDGYSFKSYTHVFGESKSSWIHAIKAIYEDDKKNIWLLSRSGLLSCFIRKEQGFKQYITTPNKVKAICFTMDEKSSIWIGYEDGTITNIAGRKLTTRKISENQVNIIVATDKEDLYVFTNSGILVYNMPSDSITVVEKPECLSFVDADISGDTVVIFNSIDFVLFNKKNPQQQYKGSISQNNRSSAYYRVALSENGFYYTDGFLIHHYNRALNIKEEYTISDQVTFNKNEAINDIIVDRSGIIWIGSSSGLYTLDIGKQKFNKYSISNRIGKLSNNYVRAIFEDSHHKLWVGYKSGFADQLQYNHKNKRQQLWQSHLLDIANTIHSSSYTVNTFIETENGTLLAGGQDGILIVGSDKKLHYMLPLHLRYQIQEVWSLYEDMEQNLWIGTNGLGLYIYNPKNGCVYHYTNKDTLHSISNNSIWSITGDAKGNIWLCTNRGLNRVINPGNIRALEFENISLGGIKNNKVWNVTEDKYGTLWIGTIGNGLYKLPEGRTATHVDEIPTNDIASLTIDKLNNFWISSTNGLYKYSPKDKTTEYFTEDDGLVSSDFNFNAACMSSTGDIFLGTKVGMISFNPDKIKTQKPYYAPLIITSLYIEGIDSTKAIYRSNQIDLSRKQNDISIDFAMLDYSTSRSHKFRYKLTGYDNNWVYLPPRHNRATFTNLSPGKYSFIVEGSTSAMNWSRQRAAILITIHPAIWQQSWFVICITVTIAILLILVIRRRFTSAIQKERKKTELEKKIAGLELRALQAQMNPHFVFNTLNSIQHFILHHNETEANNYLSRFAKLMRLFLESSKERYILLKTELELLELYMSLEHLRFEGTFEYKIKADDSIATENIKIPSMLIQPFVENAIKHGLSGRKKGGMLLLNFEPVLSQPNTIRCTVDDNGIGRQKALAHKPATHVSRGTELIEDRIKTYNFIEDRQIKIRVIDKSYPEEGTIVEIILPTYPLYNKTI